MTSKKGQEYERSKPGIGLNTILKSEEYEWKKFQCLKRHHQEWLPDRKAFSETDRPRENGNDEGWERKCFDFLEPFFLSGCLNSLRGGAKQATFGKHGPQVDILFSFEAWAPDFSSISPYLAICEAKSSSNLQDAYERALKQLYERDMEIKKVETATVLPIVFLKHDRGALNEPTETYLFDLSKRKHIIWENDIDFYITQARDLGWKRAWKLFLLEVLHVRTGTMSTIDLPAIRFKIKKKTGYSVFLPAEFATNICHVERARKKAPHGLYQRPLDMSRLKEIAPDLENPFSLSTCFPNSIVASLDNDLTKNLEAYWAPSISKEKEIEGNESEPGILHLPDIYGLIKIIDGQHRVFAHDLINPEARATYGIPFTILENLLPREEMVIFKSINTTAEDVNANLVDIILYSMKEIETDRGLASSIICTLAFEDEDWRDFFEHLGTGLSDYDFGKRGIKIKIDNLVQPLIRKEWNLIREQSKGYLNPPSIDDKVGYGCSVLKEYLLILHTKFKYNQYDFWRTYIRTRPGIRLMLYLLSQWIKTNRLLGNKVEDLDLDGLVDYVYSGKNIIRKEFEETKGKARGDEFIHSLASKILSD